MQLIFIIVIIFIMIGFGIFILNINKKTCKECGLKIKNKYLTRCPKCGYVLTKKGV